MHIKKEVSLKKIADKYKPIIKDVKNKLLEHSEKIHSIYLYGSVATGKAKSPSSDLDIIIVLKRKPTTKLQTTLKILEKKLTKKYEKTFREVGFAITYKNEILKGKESFGWKFFISTLSVKIHGEKLFEKTPKFYPTKKLAKHLHSDVEKKIKKAIKEIKSKSEKETKLKIKSIMKKIIRTAFAIIMEKENYWTTDLKEMTKIFEKHYPNKKKEINKTLQLIFTNTPNKNQSLKTLKTFGKWISKEFFKKIA